MAKKRVDGISRGLLAERMLGAEMEVHLAAPGEREAGNHRNGTFRKTVDTGSERIVLDIPWDRQGRLDPVLIGKHQRRLPGFDGKTIAMYAWGMSTRDIQAHIEELYGIGVSATLVSAVTDAMPEDVFAWQNRPLEPVHAIVHFDALRVKICDEGLVRNKAVYLAIGITCSGDKEGPGRSWPNSSAAAEVRLAGWSETWPGRSAAIYRLNEARLARYEPGQNRQSAGFDAAQDALGAALAGLPELAREGKALRSLVNHREGLSVFADRPRVPLDNNLAERLLRAGATTSTTATTSARRTSGSGPYEGNWKAILNR